MSYRGRFAPSPTGDLHFGSLLAALVSYLQARKHGGDWLVRIEDIDETRTIPGADQKILQTLSAFGMHSDEPVMYQTDPQRQAVYQQALTQLTTQQLTFPCTCTRKQLAGSSVYPGTCRNHPSEANKPHSIRVKTQNQSYTFDDLFQGVQIQNLATQSGDFNIKRKDGLFCYMLAVVLDDADQGISEVVRGIDIMDSTARQMYLIELLGLTQPSYAHFPVVVDTDNQKLSKQNHAKPVTHEDPMTTTSVALELLGMTPPTAAKKTQSSLLDWAIKQWQPERLRGITELRY